jgi:hypothetical protein
MKLIMTRIMLVLASLLVFSPAYAIRRGDQGVGVMIGNPSGFSYKMWLDEGVAIDAAAGVDQGEFDLHTTFLIHNFDTAKGWAKTSSVFKSILEDGDLPWYFGAGPRVLFEDKTEFGVRFPVGFSFLPHDSPWETFAEFAPILRFTPDVGIDADFGIGLRYYFPAIRPRN